ncbi:MAG: transketolase [Candidatus Parcubacteria bacterium]|nr:transketolase [Candidatus Parcubacteria bacterium]
MHLTDEEIKKLENIACQLRQDVISMLLEAKTGHSAGPLGMADVFTVLYFTCAVNHDPKNPDWPERDRIILSNGHICPIQYAAMARAGYFPVEELKTLRKFGSRLQGHPHREKLPGIETSSGPLGSGLSQAAGMAYAFRLNKTKQQVVCLMGDGEQDCGQVWEAAMWAGKNKLDNLTIIIDRNNIQIDGFTEDVMPLEPLRQKYESFGWHVLEIDGNNIRDIYDAIFEARAIFEKPVCIIAHTIPGKGVDFMEFDFAWHGKPPQPEEGNKALEQLRTLQGRISTEL